MAGPNPAEQKLLIKFRERLEDSNLTEEQMDPIFLLRFIRARDTLDQSEAMLRQSMKWRIENDVDHVQDWTPPEVFTVPVPLCPYEFLGYDRDSAPIIWVPVGQWKLRQIVGIGEKDNALRYFNKLFETTMNHMKGQYTSEDYPVTQCVYLADLDQLSFLMLASPDCIDLFRKVVTMLEANYPEFLKAVFLVNAGPVFTSIFAIIKPLLSVKTCEKFQIFGRNPTQWPSALLKLIPREVLPTKYGGSGRQLMPLYPRRHSLYF